MKPGNTEVQARFTGLVLAGDRGTGDPVAAMAGVACKAFCPVDGTPMLARVLDALESSPSVDKLVLSGPRGEVLHGLEGLREGIDSARWRWLEPGPSPSVSAGAAMNTIEPASPVLLTTADHALLRPEIVEHFCDAAWRTGADLVVGMVRYEEVMHAFPGMRRTGIRFRDGKYCGCNLYAFLSPDARRAAEFWRRVEQDRKKPWRMIRGLGWYTLLRFVVGRLTLDDALLLLSERIGVAIDRVMLPYPEAAVDVDKPSDWEFVERLFRAEA